MGEKVAEGVMPEDMVEGTQCSNHPYRRNPSGICAFCLQEKLGKLVSSSKSSDPFLSINPPPTSSSSPSSFSSADPPSLPSSFLPAEHCRLKMKTTISAQSTPAPIHKIAAAAATNPCDEVIFLNRSKSVAPRRRVGPEIADPSETPRKKSFWSFFTLTKSSSALIPSFGKNRRSASSATVSFTASNNGGADLPKTPRREQEETSKGNDDASGSPSGSQASSSFGRKVTRSRSVGCGSRSFSGDFLERISNGFGDCTLRRVESHREAKSKLSIHRRGDEDSEEQIKERVKCGSIFVGLCFSSSIYWLSAADACDESCRLRGRRRGSIQHGRNKSWSWVLASPMRVFRTGGVGSTIGHAGGIVAGGQSGTPQC